MRVTRVGPRELRVEFLAGLFPTVFSRYMRSVNDPFERGHRYEVPGSVRGSRANSIRRAIQTSWCTGSTCRSRMRRCAGSAGRMGVYVPWTPPAEARLSNSRASRHFNPEQRLRWRRQPRRADARNRACRPLGLRTHAERHRPQGVAAVGTPIPWRGFLLAFVASLAVGRRCQRKRRGMRPRPKAQSPFSAPASSAWRCRACRRALTTRSPPLTLTMSDFTPGRSSDRPIPGDSVRPARRSA